MLSFLYRSVSNTVMAKSRVTLKNRANVTRVGYSYQFIVDVQQNYFYLEYKYENWNLSTQTSSPFVDWQMRKIVTSALGTILKAMIDCPNKIHGVYVVEWYLHPAAIWLKSATYRMSVIFTLPTSSSIVIILLQLYLMVITLLLRLEANNRTKYCS